MNKVQYDIMKDPRLVSNPETFFNLQNNEYKIPSIQPCISMYPMNNINIQQPINNSYLNLNRGEIINPIETLDPRLQPLNDDNKNISNETTISIDNNYINNPDDIKSEYVITLFEIASGLYIFLFSKPNIKIKNKNNIYVSKFKIPGCINYFIL